MPLNFGGQKRSGAFDMVWPTARFLISDFFLENMLPQCCNAALGLYIWDSLATRHDPRQKMKTWTCAASVIWHWACCGGVWPQSKTTDPDCKKKQGKQPRNIWNFQKSCSRCGMTLSMLCWSISRIQDHNIDMTAFIAFWLEFAQVESCQHPQVFPGGPPPQY